MTPPPGKGPLTYACVVAVWLIQGSVAAQQPTADSLVTYTEDRAACTDRNPIRNAYFGDLHVHTAWSYDAMPFGLDTTPADAYRFAQGEAIPIPPYDRDGNAQATLQLRQPLDFAAVTDHAEFFGEIQLCTDPASAVRDSDACQSMLSLVSMIRARGAERAAEICGEDGAACRQASISLWQRTRDMAEAAYDRSDKCSFTTFIGYEYTGTPNGSNIHRNVIFRNAHVPERAISYVDAPSDQELWAQLNTDCLQGTDGCDVMAIPHNSNLSAGAMFPSYRARFDSADSARQVARIRNRMEPVMEVFQHKGNSECFNGLPDILGATDELCNVEQIRSITAGVPGVNPQEAVDFCAEDEIGAGGMQRLGCISKNDFYRSVLLTGLEDYGLFDINTYRLGVIASTDTHISAAGATDENTWPGHLVPEMPLPQRLTKFDRFPVHLDTSPGGLAGVWAVENSRDALFDGLRRREVFGTSGTRIRPRLFGGWDIHPDACQLADTAEHGYRTGTPMGGDFSAGPGGAKPRFLATAIQDPMSAPLQKLQLIKGWIDAAGQAYTKVIDIAGQDSDEGNIDLQTGEWRGPGSASLCVVFEDAGFDPAEPVYYYLRAVQVPTLRWSWAQCVALPPDERPAQCNNEAPRTTREMAWTSPIWYLPETGESVAGRGAP
jgi:hypothetical protein